MYYILYGILWLISLLPFRVLYIFSDGIFILLYHVLRYRRDVVLSNLRIAFPEKTDEELRKISKEFFHNFLDNFIETIKLLSISKKRLAKHFTSTNPELLDEQFAKGHNIQVHLGHFFNWEFANAYHSSIAQFPFLVIYMPISSKAMDRIFIKLRTRFGSHLISSPNFRREFIKYARQFPRFCMVYVADQNPPNSEDAYWIPFFNRLTPFTKGPEKSARLNKSAIFMCNFHKVKRGYYNSVLTLITEDPSSFPDGELTQKLIGFIEDDIRTQPANYLWSHRRWKHQFDPERHSHLVISREGSQ